MDVTLLWLGLGLLLVTLPGTIELALLTIGALLPSRSQPPRPCVATGRLGVIVPVYNEEAGLARTIASILDCQDPVPAADIVVMACNCTDRTVEVARRLGCTVIERHDPTRRGKGYGLDHAFRQLSRSSYGAYVIVDADTVVAANFLTELRRLFATKADAGQTILNVANSEASPRTRLMKVAFLGVGFLRPLGRHRLGLSAGILGNGFAVRTSVVEQVPYECFSIAEDLEYHVRLVRAGKKVEFVPTTSVSTEMCVTAVDAESQRERWEGGRFRNLIDQAPGLVGDIVLRGRLMAVEPLLDLLLLPLGYHVLLLALLAIIGTGGLFLYAVAGMGIVMAHVALAMWLGRASRADWQALLMVPAFVAWKAARLPGILKAASKSTPWQRTARGNSQGV